MKLSKRIQRDPYFIWKLINMVLACAILILAGFVLFGGRGGILVQEILVTGILMCALSGIMELSKNKRVIGYGCSIFAGVLTVALIFSIIRML